MKEHGKEAVSFGSKFRDQRELFIGSLFSLGISSRTGRYNWIRKTEEDPPDVELAYLEDSPQGDIRCIAQMEIVEFQKYSSKNLLETLKTKLRNCYPKKYLLLCFIHSRKEIIYPLELSNAIKLLNPQLTAIYIMANCEKIDASDDRNMELVQVFPNLEKVKFNITKTANSWPKNMSHRAKLTRGG